MKVQKISQLTLAQTLPFILLIGGMVGVLSAGILMIEKIHLLRNPGSALGCDLNPVIACGSVINTAQASAFGFPNPIIGLVGFGMVATVGAAMLAGARFRRWFWLGLQAGVAFGIGFVAWLQFQSVYRIGALCPYCMVVWTVMIPIFWYTTLYNLRQHKVGGALGRLVGFSQRHHADILLVWYLAIIGLVVQRFWYFWKTLI